MYSSHYGLLHGVKVSYIACLFWTVANLVSYIVPCRRLYGARTLSVRGVILYTLYYVSIVCSLVVSIT